MSLESLPVELLTLLGGFCGYAQLASSAGANHTFHAIFNPTLYKLNAADAPQRSCLHWAVEHDSLSTLKIAIAYGADINNTGAVTESYVLRLTDKENLDPDNDPDDSIVYASPLHLAILKERPEMVRWLLDNDARLDVPSYQLCFCPGGYGLSLWYPLHFAICHGNEELLCLLLERGALYSAKDSIGLYCAVTSGVLSAVKILTQLDSFDPEYRSPGHTTPLHWVQECPDLETAITITEMLVQHGVPINVQSIDGRSALSPSVFPLRLEPAIILLRHGADPTLSDEYDRGVDMLSCCFHNIQEDEIQTAWETDPRKAEAMIDRRLEFAKLVIKGGVDVNGRLFLKAAPFSRPLFWALVGTRDVRCVQLILDAGADISSAVLENYHTESESLLRCFFDLFGEIQESNLWIWGPAGTDLREYKESVCLLLEKGARIDAVGD